MRLLILGIAILVFSGCGVFEDEQDLENAMVLVTANDPELHVLNKTSTPIFFIIVERETSYLIDLADPCIEFEPDIEASDQKTYLYSEITGWHEDAEEAWYWWGNCQGLSDYGTIEL